MSQEIVFYIKKGRRYIPHSTYSSEFCDSFPKGTHLVQSYPGGSLRRFNIDPAHAPMIAAGRIAEEAISKKIMEASELRPRTTPITPAAQAAWARLKKELGDDGALTRPSARECAEAAVRAMTDEAEKLMQHESVKKAYEQFLLICELTKNHDNTNSNT